MSEKKLFRFHRGTLADSMMTKVEFVDSAHLARIIEDKIKEPVTVDDLDVRPYGFDERIDWDTHIVLLKGQHAGVLGFTNCAMPD